jgi:hypothetical protein
MKSMTLGTSTFLIAVGAIMRYAITAQGDGFDVRMIGTILMIVGAVGAVVTLVLYASVRNRRRIVATGPRGTVQVVEGTDRIDL